MNHYWQQALFVLSLYRSLYGSGSGVLQKRIPNSVSKEHTSKRRIGFFKQKPQKEGGITLLLTQYLEFFLFFGYTIP